ncbi:MAG: hypothetical protein KDA92_08765, partial [Planctomycetales bacterium]|nr:hypothetical protein [Planctomycetales bacterium]
GQQSTSPSDVEMYFRGYIEVPNCCNSDGSCSSCQVGGGNGGGAPYDGQVIEVPGSSQSIEGQMIDVQPALNQSSFAPRSSAVRTAGRDRTVRPVSHSISGRQIRSTDKAGATRTRSEDPGLFGRVGYDVLD